MKEEKWIRNNITDNPERGRRISNVTKAIAAKIALNNAVKRTQTHSFTIYEDLLLSKQKINEMIIENCFS